MHTVFFSDEGLPDTYTATNFVKLRPGDGEQIVGMATFRDLLIVFKQTAMYVFYSESIDDAGLVEFNYREYSLGDTIPIASLGEHMICVGEDGVYFSGLRGIYRTTGSLPSKISGPISPLYEGPGGAYINDELSIRTGALPALYWARRTLFGVYTTTNTGAHTVNSKVLVWSPDHGQWSIWHFGNEINGIVTHFLDWPTQTTVTDTDVLGTAAFFVCRNGGGGASTTDSIQMLTPAAATAVTWHYQTGYSALTTGEARTRFMDVYGNGDMDVSVLGIGGRSGAVADVASSISLGLPTGYGRARRAGTIRARLFAHRFSGVRDSSSPPRVSRIEHYFSAGTDV
jgi:hypothetical protein